MRIEIPLRMLKLDEGFHLLVNIRINGRAARVLIDTGASKTVFDKTQIKKILKEKKFEAYDKLSTGLGTNDMKSRLALVEKISLGKIVISNYKAVVMNLSHVNAAYGQMKQKPIVGVLGSDILTTYKAVIDYGKKILSLRALPSSG